MRRYLVKLVYLAKGVVEAVLGDVRRPQRHYHEFPPEAGCPGAYPCRCEDVE